MSCVRWMSAAREKESIAGPWTQLNVEKGANMLIPVPSRYPCVSRDQLCPPLLPLSSQGLTGWCRGPAAPLGGVLIVGAQTLTYHNGKTYKAIPIQTTRMCAYGVIDENGCVPPPRRSPCATPCSALTYQAQRFRVLYIYNGIPLTILLVWSAVVGICWVTRWASCSSSCSTTLTRKSTPST